MVEVCRHDAELRTQLEHVPVVIAEHAYGRQVARQRKRALFVGKESHEDGLTGAVRSQDCRMFADADSQRQPVQYGSVAFLDAGIYQLEDGLAHRATFYVTAA